MSHWGILDALEAKHHINSCMLLDILAQFPEVIFWDQVEKPANALDLFHQG